MIRVVAGFTPAAQRMFLPGRSKRFWMWRPETYYKSSLWERYGIRKA